MHIENEIPPVRWYVTLANPTTQQSDIIQNAITNHKRLAFLTLITNSHGMHNQVLVGIIEFNAPHSLIWIQQNTSPITNWQILIQNSNQCIQNLRNYIYSHENLYLWILIDDSPF
jgi:hypothetical protein